MAQSWVNLGLVWIPLEHDGVLTRNMAYTPVIHRPSLYECQGKDYGGNVIKTDLSKDIVKTTPSECCERAKEYWG